MSPEAGSERDGGWCLPAHLGEAEGVEAWSDTPHSQANNDDRPTTIQPPLGCASPRLVVASAWPTAAAAVASSACLSDLPRFQGSALV